MTVINLTEYNIKCYGVTLQNNGFVKVHNFEDISNDENNILYINPLETFLGKCKVCEMRTDDESVFDGNTILLKMSEERDKHRYFCIGSIMVCSFLNADKFYECISNKGNNLTPFSIAISGENIYFLTPFIKLIKREKIIYKKILNTIENKTNP